jgi:hypothetical protein
MRSFAALVLAILAACSSAGPAATNPTPSPRPTESRTASPLPTPDLKAFGDQYLAIVEPEHMAICAYNKVVAKSGVTLQQEEAASAALAVAERAFSDALRKVSWPHEVAVDMRDVLKAEAAFQAALIDVSTATTRLEYNASFARVADLNSQVRAASNLVRADLGIASVGALDC